MTRIIHIAGNSGAGKSILALNLGIALANMGKDTLLMDANIYSADIASYLNHSHDFMLNDYLNGECNIDQLISRHPTGMKVILSSNEKWHVPHKHTMINHALLSLKGKSEIVLVDSFSHNPALFSVLHPSDETIFVANDDYHSIAKSKEFIRALEANGMGVIGVVLNKRQNTPRKHIETILEKPVIGELPNDKKLTESINARMPVVISHPNAKISKAITEIAKLLDI